MLWCITEARKFQLKKTALQINASFQLIRFVMLVAKWHCNKDLFLFHSMEHMMSVYATAYLNLLLKISC